MTSSGALDRHPFSANARVMRRAFRLACTLIALLPACTGQGETGQSAKPAAAPGTKASSAPKPDGIEGRALRAAELYDAGKSADAERAYREILSENPEHVGSLVGL